MLHPERPIALRIDQLAALGTAVVPIAVAAAAAHPVAFHSSATGSSPVASWTSSTFGPAATTVTGTVRVGVAHRLTPPPSGLLATGYTGWHAPRRRRTGGRGRYSGPSPPRCARSPPRGLYSASSGKTGMYCGSFSCEFFYDYDVFAGCLWDVFRSIDAAASTHSRRASAAVANLLSVCLHESPWIIHADAMPRSPRASASHRCLLAVRLRDNLGTVHAVATPRSPHASGGAFDVLTGCLRDILRSIDAAAPTDPFTSRIRDHHELLTRRLRESPRIIHADATSRSPRASASSRCLPAVRLRTNLGTVDLAATLPSPRMSVANKNCPPRASGTSSGSSSRLRRPIHLALAVLMTTLVFGCLRDRLRDRLRTILARVSTPFTGVTATSSVWSAQQPSRASGNLGPGVEDGGQDKGVVSRVG
jgi:hypothetical protein